MEDYVIQKTYELHIDTNTGDLETRHGVHQGVFSILGISLRPNLKIHIEVKHMNATQGSIHRAKGSYKTLHLKKYKYI